MRKYELTDPKTGKKVRIEVDVDHDLTQAEMDDVAESVFPPTPAKASPKEPEIPSSGLASPLVRRPEFTSSGVPVNKKGAQRLANPNFKADFEKELAAKKAKQDVFFALQPNAPTENFNEQDPLTPAINRRGMGAGKYTAESQPIRDVLNATSKGITPAIGALIAKHGLPFLIDMIPGIGPEVGTALEVMGTLGAVAAGSGIQDTLEGAAYGQQGVDQLRQDREDFANRAPFMSSVLETAPFLGVNSLPDLTTGAGIGKAVMGGVAGAGLSVPDIIKTGQFDPGRFFGNVVGGAIASGDDSPISRGIDSVFPRSAIDFARAEPFKNTDFFDGFHDFTGKDPIDYIKNAGIASVRPKMPTPVPTPPPVAQAPTGQAEAPGQALQRSGLEYSLSPASTLNDPQGQVEAPTPPAVPLASPETAPQASPYDMTQGNAQDAQTPPVEAPVPQVQQPEVPATPPTPAAPLLSEGQAPPLLQSASPKPFDDLMDTFDKAGAFANPMQKTAATVLWRARASAWSRETGRPKEDFYTGIKSVIDQMANENALTQRENTGTIDQATPAVKRSPQAMLKDVAGVVGNGPTTKVGFSIADIAKTGKVTLPSGATFDAFGGPFYHLPGFDPNAGSGNAWAAEGEGVAQAHHNRAAQGAALHFTLSNSPDNVLNSHGVLAIKAEIDHALSNNTMSPQVLFDHIKKTVDEWNKSPESNKLTKGDGPDKKVAKTSAVSRKFTTPKDIPDFVKQLDKLDTFNSRRVMSDLFWKKTWDKKTRKYNLENPFGYGSDAVADALKEPAVAHTGTSDVINAFLVNPHHGPAKANDSLHPIYGEGISGDNLGLTKHNDITVMARGNKTLMDAVNSSIADQGIKNPSVAKLKATIKGFMLMGNPAKGHQSGGILDVPTPDVLSFFTQKGDDGVKAWYDRASRTFGAMTGKSDFSSFVHETWHDWTASLTNEHTNTLEKHFGDRNSVDYQEKGARAFERYLRDGIAPTPKLKGIFNTIRDAMVGIYQKIKGTPIEEDVHPEVRDVFDKILGKGEEPNNAEETTGSTNQPDTMANVATHAGSDGNPETPTTGSADQSHSGDRSGRSLLMEDMENHASALGVTLPDRDTFATNFEAIHKRAVENFSNLMAELNRTDIKNASALTPEHRVAGTIYLKHLEDTVIPELRGKLDAADKLKDKASADKLATEFSVIMDKYSSVASKVYKAGSEAGRNLVVQKMLVDAPLDVVRLIAKAEKLKGADLSPGARRAITDKTVKARGIDKLTDEQIGAEGQKAKDRANARATKDTEAPMYTRDRFDAAKGRLFEAYKNVKPDEKVNSDMEGVVC